MILWNKRKQLFSFLIINLLVVSSLFGQDLFNLENSRKFASYLFETKQYSFASEEFERVIYLDPNDTTSWLHLVSSYRLDNRHNFGIERLSSFYPDPNAMSGDFAQEYLHLLYLKGEFNKADSFLINYNGFGMIDKQCYRSNFSMLLNSWEKSSELLLVLKNPNSIYYDNLYTLIAGHHNIRYKSPFKAGLMSGVIPGSGKFYTKNWQDGVIAFIFVTANAWQSYRGFKKHGTKSAYGWIFGTLSAGFYIGNIFGSVKSAKRYNHKLDDELYIKSANTLVDNL